MSLVVDARARTVAPLDYPITQLPNYPIAWARLGGPLLCLILLALSAAAFGQDAAAPTAAPAPPKIDTGDTAWMLASTALVMFMTPGLALFYGGMVRAKNVLGMLMQNFFCLGLISVIWATLTYSLAFHGDNKWIGNLDLAWMRDAAT